MPDEAIPTFDLYAELGVPTSAGHDQIETAFRTLAKLHHPDAATDQEAATARMKRLNLARTWLSDPVRRARYDQVRGVRHGPEPAVPRIDPLGPWPSDTAGYSGRYRQDPTPESGLLRNTIVLIAFMVLIAAFILGAGSLVAAAAALLCSVILVFFGLLWVMQRLRPPRQP